MVEDHIVRQISSLYKLGFGSGTIKGVLAAGLVTMAAVLPAQAENSGWIPMREVRTNTTPSDSNIVRIWKDVLKGEADQIRAGDGKLYVKGKLTTLPADGFRPSRFLWAEFKTEKADYIVSIMAQRPPACDNGANGATATTIHAVCPARLTTLPKDGTAASTTEMPGGCAIWPSDLDEPKDDTGSFAKIEGDTVALEAIQGGTTIAGCNLSFSLK